MTGFKRGENPYEKLNVSVQYIETIAENAWNEGLDADANPYSKHQKVEYNCWYTR